MPGGENSSKGTRTPREGAPLEAGRCHFRDRSIQIVGVYHHFHDSGCQIVLDRRGTTAGDDRSRQLDVAIQRGRKIINRRLQLRYNLPAGKSSGFLQR
jgi:hypothetical protein